MPKTLNPAAVVIALRAAALHRARSIITASFSLLLIFRD